MIGPDFNQFKDFREAMDIVKGMESIKIEEISITLPTPEKGLMMSFGALKAPIRVIGAISNDVIPLKQWAVYKAILDDSNSEPRYYWEKVASGDGRHMLVVLQEPAAHGYELDIFKDKTGLAEEI